MRQVCGLDVHKDSVFVCILNENGIVFQDKFGVLTPELEHLASVLQEHDVGEVCMESTSINRQIQDNPEQEKAGKSFDFPALVDYTSKLSNFFEDLQKLDAFAQSVEYLLVDDGKEKKNH